MADYIRARTPEQKQERLDAILAAADAVFARQPYHTITMGTIASELGWSRSNLYKYVGTKEEIFLALHSVKNRAWLNDLEDALAGAPLPDIDFAIAWAQVTARHVPFLHCQDLLVTVIEPNVSLERLVQFKRDFVDMAMPICDILMAQCDISREQAIRLYVRLLYEAPPLCQHFHIAEKAREAERLAGFPSRSGSFADAYADFTAVCLAIIGQQVPQFPAFFPGPQE